MQEFRQGDFVEALVSDLTPVVRASPLSRALLTWITSGSGVVALLLFARAPFREGGWVALMTSPSDQIQLVLGVAATTAALAAGLEWSVPGRTPWPKLVLPVALFFSAWVAWLVFETLTQANQPIDMTGKRWLCEVEIAVQSIPCALIAAMALRRRVIQAGPLAFAFLGAAAASLPAVWMQLACMDVPQHALTHHLGPVLAIGLIGGAIGLVVQLAHHGTFRQRT